MKRLAVLHPCRRRAGIWSRTAADTDAPRCTERQEAQSSRNACPSLGGRRGTSPSRGCEEGGGGVDRTMQSVTVI